MQRALMSKLDPELWDEEGIPCCGCGQDFNMDETVMLYPVPDCDWHIREAVCLTCHFWWVHNVFTAIEEYE